MSTHIPNPSAPLVTAWLHAMEPGYLQTEGWQAASQHFAGIIAAAREYGQEHFSDQPERQEAFFDGVALALAALGHFADINQLTALLAAEVTPAETRELMIIQPKQ
jgi:hypothetical protein